jgi:hypothetical protein
MIESSQCILFRNQEAEQRSAARVDLSQEALENRHYALIKIELLSELHHFLLKPTFSIEKSIKNCKLAHPGRNHGCRTFIVS